MKKHQDYEAWQVVGMIVFVLVLMIIIHGILTHNIPTYHRFKKGHTDPQPISNKR